MLVGCVAALLAALVAAPACSSDSGSGGGGAAAGAAAGSADGGGGRTLRPVDPADPGNPPTPKCYAGVFCRCINEPEAVGVTVCDGDVQTCACESCPEPTPTTAKPFEACGGEPFGRWGSKQIAWDDFKLGIATTSGSSQSTGYCGGVLKAMDPAAVVFLELRDGGDVAVASNNFNFSFDLKKSCASGCDDLKISGKCTSSSCGTCSCDAERGGLTGEGTWSRKDGTLELALWAGKLTLSYCVEGNQLTVRDEANLELVFERVSFAGNPIPCSERGADNCVGRGDCALGACVGATKCAAVTTEATCGASSGCTWDTQACAGKAAATCELYDYRVTPGCEVKSGQSTCVGVATSCGELAKFACQSNPGCVKKAGCVGGTKSCRQFDHACGFCSGHLGCACDDAGLCQGTSECENHDFGTCEVLAGCTWTECSGEAVACGDLSDVDCVGVPGCELVAP